MGYKICNNQELYDIKYINEVLDNIEYSIFAAFNKIYPQSTHTSWDNNNPYYIQGGFVFGPADKMLKLCETWQNRINYYINKKHKVPEWHDETALNELFNSKEYHNDFRPTFIFKYQRQNPNTNMTDAFAELNLSNVKPEFKINY